MSNMAEVNELSENISKKILAGNYRGAVESLLQEMANIADDCNDEELRNEIDEINAKVFDIPNIDWGKTRKRGKIFVSETR